MSDTHAHGHLQLSPHSIRFCPLCGTGLERRPVPPEDKHEMVCTGCCLMSYLTPAVVAATIPEDDGRVLMTRRTIQPSSGKWTFPGGFLDWGERVEEGAVRETWEETGLKVDLGGVLGVYSYAGTPIVIVVYRARVVGGEIRICHENDRVEWVEPAKIPWGPLPFPSTQAPPRDRLPIRSAYLSGARDERGGGLPRDHLLALLVLRPQLEIHEHGAIALLGRALGHYLAAAGDHVAQAHEGGEAHADLADAAHPEPLRHRLGHEAHGEHAVGEDVAHARGLGESRVLVDGIEVARGARVARELDLLDGRLHEGRHLGSNLHVLCVDLGVLHG